MNILNGNEAFSALMAGKKIMCRAVGKLVDFNDLDQFPATIFAMPGYEFSIKIDLIEVAGITFTKPLTLDELVVDQDIFIVWPTGIIQQYKYHGIGDGLVTMVDSGFAQRDFENAKLQYEAFCKSVGGTPIQANLTTAEQQTQPEKKRQSRKKTDTSVTIADVEPSGVESEDTPWEVATATKEPKHAFTVDDVEVIEEDPLKIVEKFTDQINACTTTDSVLELRYSFAANGHLDDTHVHHLMKLVEDKCVELDPEQYAPKIEIISQENVTTSEDSLIDEIDSQATKAVQDKIYKDAISDNAPSSYPIDMLYSKKKQMLINRIYDMDSVEALERLAPAIPAAKLKPEDHQELLSIYAERKTAMMHVDGVAS